MTHKDSSGGEIMQEYAEKMEDQLKTQHSKNAIFFFFLFGIIIFLWKGEPLLSLGGLAFFFIGMFLASFLSILSYLVKVKLSKNLTIKQAYILKNFYWIFEIIYDFAATYFLFYIYTLII